MELTEHVLSAIDDYESGKKESALMHSCFAIEATSRNFYKKNSVGNKEYKDLIRNYYWIIEFMMPGVNLEETKFRNLKIDNGYGKLVEDPDFADVIYHIFRSNNAHAKPVPQNYKMLPVSDGLSRWKMGNDLLQIPERIIWALLAVTVFSKANKSIQSVGDYYLSWGSEVLGLGIETFPISDWWGEEKRFKLFVSKHSQTKIALMFS